MTLCNNLQQKWGVGVFSGVGIFSRDYGILVQKGADLSTCRSETPGVKTSQIMHEDLSICDKNDKY